MMEHPGRGDLDLHAIDPLSQSIKNINVVGSIDARSGNYKRCRTISSNLETSHCHWGMFTGNIADEWGIRRSTH